MQKEMKNIIKVISGLKTSRELEEIKYFSKFNYKNPIDNYINESYVLLKKDGGHFNLNYREWRIKRIRKILNIFGIEWKGKRILELGSGLGDIGGFFAELGAEVLSIDGKIDNVNFANLKYRHLKEFKSVCYNLENDFSHFGKFDLIINFGLIEMMGKLDNLLECCSKMSNNILIETEICDSSEQKRIFIERDKECSDSSINGIGIRPSSKIIQDFFKEKKFKMKKYFDEDLNTETHNYTWEVKDSGKSKDNMRRFWLFYKEKKENEK